MPSRNPRKRQHSSGSQSAKMCQIKIGKSQSEWECLGTLVGTKLAQKTVYELTVEFSTGSEVITMSTSRAGTILSRDGAPCLWDEFEGDQVASVCFHDKQLHEAVAAQFSERRVATTEPEEIDSVSDVDDDTAPWRLATELESVREEVAGLRHLQRDMAELRSMLAGLQASFDAKIRLRLLQWLPVRRQALCTIRSLPRLPLIRQQKILLRRLTIFMRWIYLRGSLSS
eukprot:gene7704-biopygen4813